MAKRSLESDSDAVLDSKKLEFEKDYMLFPLWQLSDDELSVILKHLLASSGTLKLVCKRFYDVIRFSTTEMKLSMAEIRAPQIQSLLCSYPSVTKFTISHCRNFDDCAIETLVAGCRLLEFLSLATAPRVSDVGLGLLARCSELKHLFLRGLDLITARSVCDTITKMAQLRRLAVTNCKMFRWSMASVAVLLAGCPLLELLQIELLDDVVDLPIDLPLCQKLTKLCVKLSREGEFSANSWAVLANRMPSLQHIEIDSGAPLALAGDCESISEALAQLASLHTLRASARLSAGLPVSRLAALTALALHDITAPQFISEVYVLSSLTDLSMSARGNGESLLVQVARFCGRLQRLKLENVLFSLSDCEGDSLGELESAEFSRCGFRDEPRAMLVCPRLVSFQTTGCRLRESNWSSLTMPILAPNLRKLSTGHSRKLCPGGITALYELRINDGTALLPHVLNIECLRQLRVLVQRNIWDPDISTAIASMCPLLEQLDVTDSTMFDDACLHDFATHCPLLRELRLTGTSVTDGGIRHLTECTALSVLHLDRTLAGDESLVPVLSALPALTALRLAPLHTSVITNNTLIALGQHCKRLRTLHIAVCGGIDDAGVLQLAAGCPRLQEARFPRCMRVTRRSSEALMQRCPLLQAVEVSGMQLQTALRALASPLGSQDS